MVIVKAEIQGHPVILANIYASNLKNTLGMPEHLLGKAEQGHNYPVILGWDILDLYRSTSANSRPRRAVDIMNNICKDWVWRMY